MSEEKRKPTACIMSFKRLNDIKRLLEQHNVNDVEQIMEEICEVINFNPDYRKGMYTKEHGQRMAEYKRRKAAEQGKSIYEVFSKVKST